MAFRDFAVSTSFKAKDKMTKGFKAMGRGAKKFAATAVASFRRASASAGTFKSVTGGILAAGAITRGLRVLTGGLRSVTEQFIEFDQATIGAAVRFKDIGPDAVDFQKQLGKIRDRAREAGAATEFTAAQSAAALNFLAKAGFTSAEAMGTLSSMINLATATGEDFATVADFSSDLLGAFGFNVDDSAQKIKNLARLNDVLVKAANTANVTVEDLFETMKIAAPIATGLGQSLESVTAVTAFLGGAGIKGSQAATALKNTFLNLAAPTTKAAGMIRALGIDVDDGTGNMRQLVDIFADLGPELDKMGNIKAAKILNEIFGKRAIAGAINIGKGTDAIREFEKSLIDAGGTAKKTADILRKSIGNRLKALGSASTELGFKILEAFEVRGETLIDKMTELGRNFDADPIVQGIEDIITTFKVLWPIVKGVFGAIAKVAEFTGVVAAEIVTFIQGPGAGKPLTDSLFGEDFDPQSVIPKSREPLGQTDIKTLLESRLLDKEVEPQRVPPNQEEAAARQQVNFNGQIKLNGFPPGTTTESKTTGAPDIDMALLGGP